MMRRALALIVLGVLAAGSVLEWTCADACAPGSRQAATKAECHGASGSLRLLSSSHDCSSHAPALGPVVVSRVESHAATVGMPRSAAIDVAIIRQPFGDTQIGLTGADPRFLSANIPLRI